jgi:hypothetical protein
MSEDVSPILSDIGFLVAEDVRANPDGAFMYAEVEEGCVGSSIFKDIGDRVVYRETSSELMDRIRDLWEAAPKDKKWNALFYTITGKQFDARFQYDEGWDPKEHEVDRRPRVLKAKYGDKPIDFSDP